MKIILLLPKLILLIALFNIPVYAQNVIPNFQQGVLNQRSETKSTTVEDIKSFEQIYKESGDKLHIKD